MCSEVLSPSRPAFSVFQTPPEPAATYRVRRFRGVDDDIADPAGHQSGADVAELQSAKNVGELGARVRLRNSGPVLVGRDGRRRRQQGDADDEDGFLHRPLHRDGMAHDLNKAIITPERREIQWGLDSIPSCRYNGDDGEIVVLYRRGAGLPVRAAFLYLCSAPYRPRPRRERGPAGSRRGPFFFPPAAGRKKSSYPLTETRSDSPP